MRLMPKKFRRRLTPMIADQNKYLPRIDANKHESKPEDEYVLR
jgi:hypothetical protein